MRVVAAPVIDADELCDGFARPRDGSSGRLAATHGCYRCCTLCNVDAHACPGCGAGLQHGVGVCLRCRNDPDLR